MNMRSTSSSGSARDVGLPTARGVAAEVLIRALRDDAFAAAALDAILARTVQLDARERALATELSYGTLRVRLGLEEELARQTPKGLGQLDLEARVHLLLGAYQIIFSNRIPDFAAVSETVEAISRRRGKGLSGFANAVLRRVSELKARDAEAQRRRVLRAAVPRWLRERIVASLGEDTGRAFLESAFEVPASCLRIRTAQSPQDLRTSLQSVIPGADIVCSPWLASALRLRSGGDLSKLPGFGSTFVAQEEGSQIIANALNARAGERVLDACAGRGNKTYALADAMGIAGLDAADLHESKVIRLAATLEHQFGTAPHVFAVDWAVGVGDARGPYDAILLDAPCSGAGTLRRRPDLLLRRTDAGVAEFTALQRSLLRNVASLLAPGGRLLYAVCSILREEAELVCEPLATELGLREKPFTHGPLSSLFEGRSSGRLLPALHGTDGYFVAQFERPQ
jgi:16S rRNA (cytosine967-C5)-methyltransferase